MFRTVSTTLCGIALAMSATTLNAQLALKSIVTTGKGGAEIVSYDKSNKFILSTISKGNVHGIEIYSLNAAGTLELGSTINLADKVGFKLDGISSVAAEPTGKGFAAVTAIPEDNAGTHGKVFFLNLEDNSIITSVMVGFHPDSVIFTKDGKYALIANEGEFTEEGKTDAPGSISVITIPADISTLEQSAVKTVDFTGVDLTGIRSQTIEMNTPKTAAKPTDMEPEYITAIDGKAYVALQENNAIGVFDLSSMKWEKVINMGRITQVIDAAKKNGIGPIDDSFTGLPMPDTIASYEVDGKHYIVTANEGDARPDDGDIEKLRKFEAPIDPDYEAYLNAVYAKQGGYKEKSTIGDVRVSTKDGDLDGDGDIDDYTMFGTRSFSIIEAESGKIVYDSGSFMESIIIAADKENYALGRAAKKGPEPEGLCIGKIDGRYHLIIGAERSNQLFLFDIQDPMNPQYQGMFKGGNYGLNAPEGFLFISAEDSPTSEDTVVVGFEKSHSLTVFSVE